MKKTQLCGFLMGLSLGAAAALLFAPRSGRKTRDRITEAASNGAAFIKDRGLTVSDAVLGFIEQGKDEIARHTEGVAEAIKQGAHAYREAVH